MVSEKTVDKKLGKGTKAVHSGTSPSENSLNTPVYQTSTFYLDNKGYKMWMAGEPRAPVYSGRYYNPTNRAVERKIADLEGAEDALVFSSGMAAICTTLINFLGQGDRIVTTRNLYGGTVGVLDQDFVRFGIDVHYVDVRDTEAVEKALKPIIIFLFSFKARSLFLQFSSTISLNCFLLFVDLKPPFDSIILNLLHEESANFFSN